MLQSLRLCGVKKRMPNGAVATCCLSVVWLCFTVGCYAQAAQSPAPSSQDLPTKVVRHRKRPVTSTQTRLPRVNGHNDKPAEQSIASEPAMRPAVVTLKDGELTVRANDSDLSQILKELATISGMAIDGLNNGPRVFGVYGPGNSRDVLSALLIDSGYNYIMVGNAGSGTPRQLLLTPRNGQALALPVINPHASVSSDDEDDQPATETSPSTLVPLGPGAIVPAPAQDSSEDDNRRAQQNMQRLQHMHEQQQNGPQ